MTATSSEQKKCVPNIPQNIPLLTNCVKSRRTRSGGMAAHSRLSGDGLYKDLFRRCNVSEESDEMRRIRFFASDSVSPSRAGPTGSAARGHHAISKPSVATKGKKEKEKEKGKKEKKKNRR
jgi:hypothetical protein